MDPQEEKGDNDFPYFEEEDLCPFAIHPEEHEQGTRQAQENIQEISSSLCLFCLQNEGVPWKGREGDVISYLRSLCTLLHLPVPRYEKEQLLSFKGPRYCIACQRWIKEIKDVLDKLKNIQKQLRASGGRKGLRKRLRKTDAPIQNEEVDINAVGHDTNDDYKYHMNAEIKEEPPEGDGNEFMPSIIIEENRYQSDIGLNERTRKREPTNNESQESDEKEDSGSEQALQLQGDGDWETEEKVGQVGLPFDDEEWGGGTSRSPEHTPNPPRKKRRRNRRNQELGEDEGKIKIRPSRESVKCKKNKEVKDMVKNHDTKKNFSCPTCNYKFGSEFNLHLHMRKQHEGDPTPYHCLFPGCSKTFSNRTAYGYHKSRHDGIRPFVCNICNNTFPMASGLRKHTIVAHRDEKDKLKCDVCEKTFSTKTRLMIHMYTHSKKYPNICEHCGKGYAIKSHLENHILVKHREILFRCNFPDCGKSFYSKYYLKNHETSHVEPKGFVCEKCGKAYSNAQSFQFHKLSHLSMDERPHGCSICGARFQRAFCLKRHMMSHQGIKNFPCDICGKSFSAHSQVMVHKKVTHDRGIKPRNRSSRLEKMLPAI